jgi:hypothetical protein
MVDGLKMYFDKALPTILLYRFERQQFAEWQQRHPGMRHSDVYGAEHLLRLFGKFALFDATTHTDSSIANVDCSYEYGSRCYCELERASSTNHDVHAEERVNLLSERV